MKSFLEKIQKNILQLQELLSKTGIPALAISSYDLYLNEYTPLEDNLRYWVSGFSGSTAEVLIFPKGKIYLFIDGRYFEQAQTQCDENLVERVECKKSLSLEMIDILEEKQVKSIALLSGRTPYRFASLLEKHSIKVNKTLSDREIEEKIEGTSSSSPKPLRKVPKDFDIESTESKLKRLGLKSGEAIYVSALDSIAWLTNTLSNQIPYHSVFKAKALVSDQKVQLFFSELGNSKEVFGDNHVIEVVKFSQPNDLLPILRNACQELKLSQISFETAQTTLADYHILEQLSDVSLLPDHHSLLDLHSVKTRKEIDIISSHFESGDQAIFDTITWVKKTIFEGGQLSELELLEKTEENYRKQGATGQSFHTIAARGANGAIIHYNSSSAENRIKSQEICLLDSGGIFPSGFCTDTTRTFWVKSREDHNISPPADFQRMYTLVLKALLQIQNSRFPEGTWGSAVDALARRPLWKEGERFLHGTGHGVGLNVHEGGVRISTTSNLPMRAGQVVSLEPGLYYPGKAGVRLENIALVEDDPEFKSFLRFRNLVYIGFEEDFIDTNWLTDEEQEWLKIYQKECEKRGRTFR